MTLVQDEIQNFDNIQRHLLNEFLTRVIASKVVTPGDVVFDLGANVGFHTVDFADRVTETGKVHAFEPNPDLWANLLQYPNVRLWPVAVGDVASVETFILPLDYNQVGSLVDPRDFMGDVQTRIMSVPQVAVDLLEEATRQKVSFVKIDVERREFHAIRGMTKLLARDKPIIVYENNTPEIETLLGSIDYKVVHMLANIDLPGVLANVVAIPIDRLDELDAIIPTSADIDALIHAAPFQ